LNLLRLARFGTRHLMGARSRAVGVNLTRRCNLSCSYCKIYDNSRERMERELTVAQWKEILDKFMAHGHQHFVFTGGEPFLYQGLPELIAYASERAMTSLITNTTYLDARRFASVAPLDFITFSFDTMRPDGMLEKHSAPRLALIARECRRYDIVPSAIVTVTSQNVGEVEAMVRALDDHGISAMLSLIHSSDDPHFDFRAHTPELEFRTDAQKAALRELQERLKALKREGVRLTESNRFIDGMIDYAEGRFQIDCPAAEQFFTIDYDGYIKACHDTPASGVHALDWHDYEAMRKAVRASVKPDCNCYYNCYVYGKTGPVEDAVRYFQR
jgi:MoaA/NifB/PqqE/SkfB family radical SAM enzyme